MLQNRVNPWGQLCSVPARGSLMGNRGVLHNSDKEIVRQWKHQNWVTCLLEYDSIKRPKPFSTLDNYSELFFLDEATAFAAGHRPCNYCQRARSQAFKSAWLMANVDPQQHSQYSMAAIDKAIHAERTIRGGGKRTFQDRLAGLPGGTFFAYQSKALLVTANGYRPWTFEGYGPAYAIDSAAVVDVLTPASIVRTFAGGFAPTFHHSVNLASAT